MLSLAVFAILWASMALSVALWARRDASARMRS
jgi:hypothetical protein